MTRVAIALCVGLCVGQASGVTTSLIPEGTYNLFNHPDGQLDPPPYGLRIDELVDDTPGNDNDDFTFDFEYVDLLDSSNNSMMQMTVGATSIHIFGQAFGGRDIGSDWAADSFLGVYEIDFLFSTGVQQVPGDDDIEVVSDSNSGTIKLPSGTVINLVDVFNSGRTFRLGDTDDDSGHRGFNGISGWGWLGVERSSGEIFHKDFIDWLFTAELVPSPGASTALVGLGLMMASRRRR